MNSGKDISRQMLDFVNQYEFNKCVNVIPEMIGYLILNPDYAMGSYLKR